MKSLCLLASFSLALLPISTFGEKDDPAKPADAKASIDVTVSILPHAFLAKAIGGEHVNVTTLVTAGQDPHQFNITPGQAVKLAGSDVFFTSGMPFEAQFILKIRAGAPDLKIVQINRGISLIGSGHDHHDHDHAHEEDGKHAEDKADGEGHAEEDHAGHDHDDHHGHDHSGPDPHTWTSPALLYFQALTVHDTLAEIAPAKAEDFEQNLAVLLDDILKVDKEIAARLKPFKGKEFFVFHPAFSYFANQYGLTEKAIEVGGKRPTPKQLLAIIAEAGAAKAKTLFIEPQFDTAVAGEIARQIGATTTSVDPLTEDILTSLTEFSKALAATFTSE